MSRTVRLHEDAAAMFAAGLERIREQGKVQQSFPADVVRAAEQAAARPPSAEHIDRTEVPFVTLDPASSTDLDQAFAIERSGSDLLLRYAIADVPWFVRPGDPIDAEAWARGVTIYLPDGRASLYPPVLSEGAASLLPDGPRPAIVFAVRVDIDGALTLDGVERAVIRSRAKLAYETASAADLPPAFDEFAARIQTAEDARGSARVDTPQQEVEPNGSGGYRITFAPRLTNQDSNSSMSLATNLAVADVLMRHQTGVFRVMPEPTEASVHHLRHTARALGLDWPAELDLEAFERTLHDNEPKHAAFMMAVRRFTGGADYVEYEEGLTPWHSAMAATYCHVTAPLRRLADRYVIEAMLAIANGDTVPDHVSDGFHRLPKVMNAAENRASAVERDAIDLVEAVVLAGREGQVFDAVVTDRDKHGVRMQLSEPIVVARVNAHRVEPGDDIRVRLVSADPVARQVRFERVG